MSVVKSRRNSFSVGGPYVSYRSARGFSLVELIAVIVIIGIVTVLAAPIFKQWAGNAQVRTVAEALQNSLRLAQTTAAQTNQQTQFILTNTAPAPATLAAVPASPNTPITAKYWDVQTVTLYNVDGATAALIEYGAFSNLSPKGTIAGPSMIAFNSTGRLTAATAPTNGPLFQLYTVCVPQNISNRRLVVLVSLSGVVSMLDPATDTLPSGLTAATCPTT